MTTQTSCSLVLVGTALGLTLGCQRLARQGSGGAESASGGSFASPPPETVSPGGGSIGIQGFAEGSGGTGGSGPTAPLWLTGTVKNPDGVPIAHAKVSLAANPHLWTETASDGSFLLSSTEPTGKVEPPRAPSTRPIEHTIVVAKSGFLDTYRAVHGPQASALSVTLGPELPTTTGGDLSIAAPFVAQYLGDKLAVVTMTFDDTHTSQLTVAKPLFDLYGYKATFYLTSGSIGPNEPTNWAMWNDVAHAGYEIGNHGRIHWIKPECTPENDVWNRNSIFGGYDDIKDAIGTPPLTFAIPGGGEGPCVYPLITESGHVDWRRKDHIIYTDRIYPEGDDLTLSSGLANIDMALAHTINWNGAPLSWFLFYMHDVIPEREAVLEAMLDYIALKDDQVWCTGYGAATLYEREREDSQLEVLQSGLRSTTFRLSNHLDPTIFSQPVTVVVSLPPATTDVAASARRAAADGLVEVRARGDRLLVDLVPGPDAVYVSW